MTSSHLAFRVRDLCRRVPLTLAAALLVAVAPAAAAVAQSPTPVTTPTSVPAPGPTSGTTRPANGPAGSDPSPSTSTTSTTTTSPPTVSPLARTGPVPDAVAISSVADHPSVAPGTVVTLTLDVTDRGARPLTHVLVRSDGCGPLSAPAKTGGNGDDLLAPGETWRYTCSRVATSEVTQTSSVRATAGLDQTVTSQASSTLHLTASGVRVDLSADRPAALPGAAVTYTADVSTGDNTALSVQSVAVPECGVVLGPARLGGNGDDLLEPGETWRYVCTRILLATATTNARVTAVNGPAIPVSATAQLQVPVVHPAVSLSETVPAAVVAGTPAALVYIVSNPGDSSITGVSITSSACSPVRFVGPDPNLNGNLDPGESWTFRCGVALPSATTDITGVKAEDVLTATPVSATTSAAVVVTPQAPAGSAPAPISDPAPPVPSADPGAPTPGPDPGALGANASPPDPGTGRPADPSTNPGFQDPGYQGPAYSGPSYQGPAYNDPSLQGPAYSDPGYQSPAYNDPGYTDPALSDPGYYDSSYDPYAAGSTYADSLYNDLGDCSSYTDGSSSDPTSDPFGLTGPTSTVGPLDSTDPTGASGVPGSATIDLLAGAASQADGSSSDLGASTTTAFSDPFSTDSLSSVPPYSDSYTDYSQSNGCSGSGSLPTTGTDAGRLASGGLVLVAAGAVLVGLGRRRRPGTARGTQQ